MSLRHGQGALARSRMPFRPKLLSAVFNDLKDEMEYTLSNFADDTKIGGVGLRFRGI